MDQLDSFVTVACLCGKPHTLLRDDVVGGLGLSRWKCAGCKRRFVIACTPASGSHREEFWPLFLDDVPVTGETREDGLTTGEGASAQLPAEIHFQCRCGCKLVGKARIYGVPTRCPRCASRLVLDIGFRTEDGAPTPLLKYPDDERRTVEPTR